MSDEDLKPKRRQLARRRGPYETALASVRSRPSDPDGEEVEELVDQVVSARAQAKTGKPRQLDPDFDLEARVSIQDKAKALLRKANEDPNSDAATMVYVWVLNAVATTQGDLSSQGLKMLTEERCRHSLLTQIEFQRGEIAERDKALGEANQGLNRNARHMGRVRTLANVAERRLIEGKLVDMRGVCRQIAEAVGLAAPPQFVGRGQGSDGGTSHAATEESDSANGQGDNEGTAR
ncbi:MAG TPA: hypothetical protein VGZ29_13665 [Terriglobia bacterium]|nr:hypothetical protein [Terriglobia bacterium]